MNGAGRNGVHFDRTESGENGMGNVGGEPAINTVSVEKNSVIREGGHLRLGISEKDLESEKDLDSEAGGTIILSQMCISIFQNVSRTPRSKIILRQSRILKTIAERGQGKKKLK